MPTKTAAPWKKTARKLGRRAHEAATDPLLWLGLAILALVALPGLLWWFLGGAGLALAWAL